MTLIIGLVGEKGSGKGTFATCLTEVAKPKRLHALRFSDLLRETLDLWNIPGTRVNLQKIAVVMDEAYGVGTLSQATYERVSKIDAEIVVVDGVRWETDVELIRRFPQNTLVYITADPKVRYARTLARKENVGEANTTFEQFMQEEQAANEIAISRIGKNADYKIVNDRTLYDYRSEVARVYSSICARYP